MDDSSASVTLAEVMTLMDRLYPRDTAQSWDQVGLVTGDPGQPVRRIHLAVDPTLTVIAEARRQGANLIITHHPLLLRGIHAVDPATGKGRKLRELITHGIALFCAHTNADVAPDGVCRALASACGLTDVEPLRMVEGQPLGLVGDLPRAVQLGDFVDTLASHLPRTATGVRVSGMPQTAVRRVAVLAGAGDDAFDEVRAAAADVYITADLRHHPALEARQLAKVSGGRPCLVDAGHWASEWLWLPVLAHQLTREFGGRVDVHVSTVRTDPWDFVVRPGGVITAPIPERGGLDPELDDRSKDS